MVAHGHCRPELHRTKSLLDFLPKGVSRNTLQYFDTQSDLANHLFTRDPDLEFDPDAPIYLPVLTNTNIAIHLNRTYATTEDVKRAASDNSVGTEYAMVDWNCSYKTAPSETSQCPTSAKCTTLSTLSAVSRTGRSSFHSRLLLRLPLAAAALPHPRPPGPVPPAAQAAARRGPSPAPTQATALPRAAALPTEARGRRGGSQSPMRSRPPTSFLSAVYKS